ncbi:hypothetical protein V2E39_17320 [Chryseobacterium arthrosphaerae]|uniref:Lipoprotein n=1 Tax=Chryseobacterium arthrosphaerae TaxID=651561 RepID=A0ABU7R2X6_9FLAO
MKKFLITLSIALIFSSCSSEIDTFDFNPKFLIEINFKSGQVKEGGKVLETASPELRNMCISAVNNETLPEGYKAEILCLGSGEKNIQFHYLKITSNCNIGYYLITTNNSTTLVHTVSAYDQKSCPNRWIISNKKF